jgi:hypothetical protein
MASNPFAGFLLLSSATVHCIGYWFPAASRTPGSEQYLRRDLRILLDFAQSWTIAQTFCSNLVRGLSDLEARLTHFCRINFTAFVRGCLKDGAQTNTC